MDYSRIYILIYLYIYIYICECITNLTWSWLGLWFYGVPTITGISEWLALWWSSPSGKLPESLERDHPNRSIYITSHGLMTFVQICGLSKFWHVLTMLYDLYVSQTCDHIKDDVAMGWYWLNGYGFKVPKEIKTSTQKIQKGVWPSCVDRILSLWVAEFVSNNTCSDSPTSTCASLASCAIPGWLVVSTPLKNDGVRQLGLLFPIYGKT